MNYFNESFNWPSLNFWTHDNEILCVEAPLSNNTLTCFDLWCKAGSCFERPGEEGLAHFLEHMVFKGSKNLTAGEFDKKIEALGGSSNAATGFDDVHFYVLVPPKFAIEALQLLLDLVFEPSITPEAFKIEKEVVLEEIAQYKDLPDELIFQTLLENCWGTHPYGRPILGWEESLRKNTPDQMKFFHERLYRPNNCCLAISGIIPNNLHQFLHKSKFIERRKLKESSIPKIQSKELIFNRGFNKIFVPRLESSRLLMAWPIPPANEQLTIMGLDIVTSLLAEGRVSKLVSRLREELQIVEYIEMDITILEQGGLIILEAFCMNEEIERVQKEVIDLLRKCISTQIKEDEVNRASQLIRNGLIFNLETR